MDVINRQLQDLELNSRERSARVELLRRKIAAGDYVVDPDRIAAVLVERARFHRRVKAELLDRGAPSGR